METWCIGFMISSLTVCGFAGYFIYQFYYQACWYRHCLKKLLFVAVRLERSGVPLSMEEHAIINLALDTIVPITRSPGRKGG